MRVVTGIEPIIDKGAYAFAPRGFKKEDGSIDVISFDMINIPNELKLTPISIDIHLDNGDTDRLTVIALT